MKSALGIYIGIVPTFNGTRYLCVAFDSRGNWKSAACCTDRNEAIKRRSEMFALHRKLKRKRDRKKRRNRP